MNNLVLRQSRDFGDIISATFSYLRVHFKSLGKGLLFFSLPMVIFSAALIGTAFRSMLAAQMASGDPNQMVALSSQMFIGMIVFMLSFVVISMVVLKHMQLVDSGEEDIDMSMLMEDFARNFFGLIGLFIVIGTATLIGALALIIPGFYISVKLSLAPAIYIIEKEDFGEALGKSWSITSNYWWHTFGVNFVVSLIVNAISYVVMIPLYLLAIFVVASGASSDPQSLTMAFSIIYGLFITVIAVLYFVPIISQGLVYFNLDERKSGRGLAAKIDSLGSL